MRLALLAASALVVVGVLGCPGPAPEVEDGGGGGDGGGAGGGVGGGVGGGGGGGGGTEQDAGEDAGEDAGSGSDGGADAGAPDSGSWTPGDAGEWAGYDAGPPRLEFVCTPTKWCFSYPHPHSLPISSLVPDGKSGVFAVTPQAIGFMQGTFMRTEGPGWGWAPAPSSSAVGEAAPVDQAGLSGKLWGWGNSGIHRWNGSAWSFVRTLPTYATEIVGFDDTHGYVVGNNGMLGSLGPDGGFDIQLTDAGLLNAVWGINPNDVWTGGAKAVRHFDGVSWSDVPFPTTTEPVLAIEGSASNDVWIAGGNYYGQGFIWHWDGSTISPTTTTLLGQVKDLAVESASRAWAVTSRRSIYAWDGNAWSLIKTVDEPLTAVMRRWNGEVWVGGYYGLLISTVDGGSWIGERAPHDEARELFSVSSDERYAVGEVGTVLRWTPDAGWNQMARLTYADAGWAKLAAGWAAAPDDLWVSAGPSVFRFDGGSWAEGPLPPGMTAGAISGSSSSDVWAGNGRKVAHWDGVQWTTSADLSFNFVNAVQAFSPTSVLAGTGGGFYRWDGGTWAQAGTGYGILAMYATSPNSAWGSCDYGRIVYWNGTTTTEVRPLDFNAERLISIGGISQTDIWAGGYNTLLRWDGGSWGATTSNQYFDHSSILPFSATDVMVSTWRDGDILRYRP